VCSWGRMNPRVEGSTGPWTVMRCGISGAS
jgi:hypothetical protein